MKPREPLSAGGVAVLDVIGHGGRSLLETVRGAGFAAHEAHALDEFLEILRAGKTVVGVVAFDALRPDPQKTLRRLREATTGALLVVVYSESSPRLRLAQRLWAVGLFDYFLPRSTPPHELAPVLRQAYADAIIESAAEEREGVEGPDAARLSARIRFLHRLGAALTNRRNIESLLRELQMKLPHLVDYHVLQVLVMEPTVSRLFVFQNRRVDHDVIWKLAEETCAAVRPFSDRPITAEELVFAESDAFTGVDEAEAPVEPPTRDNVITMPMVLCGELVGCLSLLLTAPGSLGAEHRTLLQLVSYQLGTSLRNAQIVAEAESESLVDELTGAYNRRYLNRVLETEWRRAKRYSLQLSVAMIDIDYFKHFNDLHGHLVGDAVLRALTSRLREHLRDTDHLVRYGGEEFLLVMPETGPSEASLVLERMRLLLLRQPLFANPEVGQLQVTFSAGIAAFPACAAASGEELVEMADEALLVAKRSGRDRVCMTSGQSFGDLGEVEEKRRFPRIGSELHLRFVELPEFEGRTVTMSSTDLSAGGMSVRGPQGHLKRNSYALVYLEDSQKPLLSRVIWAKDLQGGDRQAGLEFLRPTDLHQPPPVEQPRSRPKALVIMEGTPTREQVERVLSAAQFESHLLGTDAREALRSQRLEDYALLVVGASSLRGEMGARIQTLHENQRSTRIVVVNEGSDRRAALETIRTSHVEHLVSSDPTSEEALFATLSKLLLGEYFGIKKYLLWGAETRAWTVWGAKDKERVIEGVRSLAEEVRCHPRVSDLLVAAVDEMIINALYRPTPDAPAKGKPVAVECGSDGRLLAVAVLDEHGLFRQEDMFRGIGQALEHEEKGLPAEAPQANLGFRVMLSALSQLAVNVDPGRCTEIIGIADLRRSLREYRAAVPSLGVFTKES